MILQSRRAEKSWIFGFTFWLGISKALAGPMDLHIFVVLDEMRFLGFLYVGALEPGSTGRGSDFALGAC